MNVKVPSPETTLLILLGASKWPLSPEFQSSQAFARSAQRVKSYFLNPRSFGLRTENLLDLFDADLVADELDVAIGQFLKQRLATMKAKDNPATDLLLYFIGHGGFVGRDSDFFLAISRTREDNRRASGLQMLSLVDRLDEQTNHLRRVIILDCCFAAAAFSAFQGGPAEVAIEKTSDILKVNRISEGFPTKGTTLLCSSNQKSPSILLPDGSSTMFTRAFLDALEQGVTVHRDRLSLRDVTKAAADILHELPNAPRPVVHSPDQSEGDVADILFFPNPWIEHEAERTRQAQEAERTRQAQEAERTRQAQEAERTRQAQEAERTRQTILALLDREEQPLKKRGWPTFVLPSLGVKKFGQGFLLLLIIGFVLFSIISNVVHPSSTSVGDIVIEVIIATILIIGFIQWIRE